MVDSFSMSRDRRDARSRYAMKLDKALDLAMTSTSRISAETLALKGMSGQKYRHMINNLVRSVHDARYLEIGCWAGSTACSAIDGNKLKLTCIDDWSEFGGPKDLFETNVGRLLSPKVKFSFIEGDFRKLDYKFIGKYNLYLFDGPHAREHQYDALAMVLPALDDEFVFIVDDWNFEQVREGTAEAIAHAQLDVLSAIAIRTTADDTHAIAMCEESDWHNGYFLSVLRKQKIEKRRFSLFGR